MSHKERQYLGELAALNLLKAQSSSSLADLAILQHFVDTPSTDQLVVVVNKAYKLIQYG